MQSWLQWWSNHLMSAALYWGSFRNEAAKLCSLFSRDIAFLRPTPSTKFQKCLATRFELATPVLCDHKDYDASSSHHIKQFLDHTYFTLHFDTMLWVDHFHDKLTLSSQQCAISLLDSLWSHSQHFTFRISAVAAHRHWPASARAVHRFRRSIPRPSSAHADRVELELFRDLRVHARFEEHAADRDATESLNWGLPAGGLVRPRCCGCLYRWTVVADSMPNFTRWYRELIVTRAGQNWVLGFMASITHYFVVRLRKMCSNMYLWCHRKESNSGSTPHEDSLVFPSYLLD